MPLIKKKKKKKTVLIEHVRKNYNVPGSPKIYIVRATASSRAIKCRSVRRPPVRTTSEIQNS